MSRRTRSDDRRLLVILVILAVLLIGEAAWIIGWQSSGQERTCTVTNADRTSSSNNRRESDVRIYTEECGVLTIADDVFRWRWNSADTYGAIRPGEYRFHTIGWRFGLFSTFPNVITAERIS